MRTMKILAVIAITFALLIGIELISQKPDYFSEQETEWILQEGYDINVLSKDMNNITEMMDENPRNYNKIESKFRESSKDANNALRSSKNIEGTMRIEEAKTSWENAISELEEEFKMGEIRAKQKNDKVLDNELKKC
jgi:hypothetical protein